LVDVSGLSSVFSRNGAMAPIRTALAARPEPYMPRYLVTSPVPHRGPGEDRAGQVQVVDQRLEIGGEGAGSLP
jgi:hypothetical protein